MASKEATIETSHVILITQQGAGIPGSPAAFSWTKTTKKAKAKSEKILVDKLDWVAAGCTSPGGTCSGNGSMNATVSKVKCNGMKVLVKGDNGTCNGTAQMPTPAPPVSTTCKVEIQDAGQTKTKAT